MIKLSTRLTPVLDKIHDRNGMEVSHKYENREANAV